MMNSNILELLAKRHSFYDINADSPVTQTEITNIVKKSLELYPSPFNSQSTRVVILFGDNHARFWELTKQELFKTAPKEKFPAIADKIASFAKGYGTILYFTDTSVNKALQAKFPLYAENFSNWAYQCSAILQFMVWSAFADAAVGASLQHYNPLVDNDVRQAFDIPESWELTAQMPFGGIGSTPAPHSVENIDEKLIIKA